MTKKGHFTTAMFAHMPIIRDIIYGAVARGASLNELLKKLHLESGDLNDSEKKLDFERAYLAWEHSLKLTKDPLLGLHIGGSSTPSILGLVGHLMQSAATMKQAFQSVCDYAEVATDMFTYELIEKKEEVILRFTPHALWIKISPSSAQQAVDQAMAGTLHVFHLLSGKSLYPKGVSFSSNRKPRVEYEKVFQCALTFQSRWNEMIFNRTDLDQPVLSYDQSLFFVFDKMLKERKAKRNLSVKEELKQIILTDFKGKVPPIEILASKLNLTVRSLQRRLASEQISFRQLSTEIKKEVTTQLLTSKKVKLKEVAALLGYSEASSFRRASKKWSGNQFK